MNLAPRNNQGFFRYKIKATSVLYGFTGESNIIDITVSDECNLTKLSVPALTTITSITYEVSSSSTKAEIDLFAHEQDNNCKFTTEVVVIEPASGTWPADYSSWLTLNGLKLEVNSQNESLESKTYTFVYKGKITLKNGNVV